eukprot:scaffold203514_cov32-Tisochrysis_lutea.AAC.3
MMALCMSSPPIREGPRAHEHACPLKWVKQLKYRSGGALENVHMHTRQSCGDTPPVSRVTALKGMCFALCFALRNVLACARREVNKMHISDSVRGLASERSAKLVGPKTAPAKRHNGALRRFDVVRSQGFGISDKNHTNNPTRRSLCMYSIAMKPSRTLEMITFGHDHISASSPCTLRAAVPATTATPTPMASQPLANSPSTVLLDVTASNAAPRHGKSIALAT